MYVYIRAHAHRHLPLYICLCKCVFVHIAIHTRVPVCQSRSGRQPPFFSQPSSSAAREAVPSRAASPVRDASSCSSPKPAVRVCPRRAAPCPGAEPSASRLSTDPSPALALPVAPGLLLPGVLLPRVPPCPTTSHHIPPRPTASHHVPPHPTTSHCIPPCPTASHRVPPHPAVPVAAPEPQQPPTAKACNFSKVKFRAIRSLH